MSTTTVFESPTALGAKLITISTTITNTSGAYTATISDERLTASMKAIKLELGNPAAFDAVINVAVNNGSLTISCASVTGTSTAVISVLKTCDDPTAITTTEFDVLANRIGDLDDLETTAKTDLVSAVNENSTAISKLGFIKELGTVTNLNITNRATEKCYHMVYEGSATGSPPSAAGGHSVLYVNSNAAYGSQVAFSNGGSFFRTLSGNTYSDWNRIALKEETDYTTITATLEDCTSTIATNECRYKYLSNNVLYVSATVRGKITAVGNPGYAAVKLNNISTTGFSAWRVLHSIREASGCFVNTPYSIALDIQSNYIKAIFESSPGVTSTKWQTTDSFYIMFSLLLVK